MREYDTLDVQEDGDVFRIQFDRPENYNATNPTCHKELSYVFEDAYESDTRVVVLSGKGKAFSAGGDINFMKERIENPHEHPFKRSMREGEKIVRDMLQVEKPIIAEVNGHATGLGATVALFCDIVVANEEAKIGDPHVSVALAAGDGGAVIWPLLTDMHTAKEMLMTGRLVTGAEAKEMGLVNYALPKEEVSSKVEELVDELATGPQTAIRYTKMALNGWLELGVNNILRESLALEGVSQRQPDHEAAVDAFLEDREPLFPSGRDPE